MAIITLGELIDQLKLRKADDSVRFDFCGQVPTTIRSYRGYYDQLALGWEEYSEEQISGKWQPKMTVGKLLVILQDAVGKTFQGYKGGDYLMDRDTNVWVSNYGEADSTAITGIADCSWMTVITTEYSD